MIVIQDLVDELQELRSTQQSQAVEIEQLRDEVIRQESLCRLNALKESLIHGIVCGKSDKARMVLDVCLMHSLGSRFIVGD